MGFYSQVVFPRLCELALNTPVVASERQHLLATAAGDVLEIGFGTGLNLPHYPRGVRKITAVDSNAGMFRRAQPRIRPSGIDVEQHTLDGQQLPFASGAFDCVVSTLTLCSIDNVSRALAEVFRVLRSGGQFLFLEHGLAPDASVRRWQRRLNWLQQWLAGGCRLDRNIKELVAAEPFSKIECCEFYLDQTPKTHGYIYRGIATK